MLFNEIIDLINLLIASWSTTGVLIFLLIYFLTHPEKVEKWESILARLFSFTGKKVKKKYISTDIQSKMNTYRKEINKECEGLVPFKTVIKFINPFSFEKERVEHKEDKVIVVLKDQKNQDENFVRATMFSIKDILIPNSRRYIEPRLMNSIDLQFVKNLILNQNKSKLNYFIDNHLSPRLDEDEKLKENINILEVLTERGVFTRILLKEIKDYGLKFYPESSTNEHFKEPASFFEKIKEFAYKKAGEDINPTFRGSNIKISIVMIGRASKVFTKTGDLNLDPYIQWVFKCEEEGISSIYILARGRTILAAQNIAAILNQMPDRFEMMNSSVYTSMIRNNKILLKPNIKKKEHKTICIHYYIKNNL